MSNIHQLEVGDNGSETQFSLIGLGLGFKFNSSDVAIYFGIFLFVV